MGEESSAGIPLRGDPRGFLVHQGPAPGAGSGGVLEREGGAARLLIYKNRKTRMKAEKNYNWYDIEHWRKGKEVWRVFLVLFLCCSACLTASISFSLSSLSLCFSLCLSLPLPLPCPSLSMSLSLSLFPLVSHSPLHPSLSVRLLWLHPSSPSN